MNTAISNPWYIAESEIMIRLILALVLGGMVGYEREHSNHAAGFRTNILVCIGACLLMLLSIYGFSDFVNEINVRVDPARLAAAVITGVGFLGAGTILFTGKKISGLTTAASLWVVAAIGLAVGAGFYFASIAVTVMVILTLWLFNKLELRFIQSRKFFVVRLICDDSTTLFKDTQQKIEEHDATLSKLIIADPDETYAHRRKIDTPEKLIQITFHIELSRKKHDKISSLIHEIKHIEGVRWIEYE